jgi:hypothetical protein
MSVEPLLVCCVLFVSGVNTLEAGSVQKLRVFEQSFTETCGLV